MKRAIFSLIMMGAMGATAATQDIQTVVESSEQFVQMQTEYKDIGGSFTCSDYKVVAVTDLEANLAGYAMEAQTVIADCAANPNDGGDAIWQKLLVFVTKTTVEDGTEYFDVASATTVTPPQPD